MATPAELLAKYTTQSQMSSFFIDKMGIINIKSYGVVGDGITDDSQKIIEFFSELEPNKLVYFPSGEYLFNNNTSSALIYIPEGTTIVGDGSSTIINASASRWFSLRIKYSNITIKNMSILKNFPGPLGSGESITPIIDIDDYVGTTTYDIENINVINCNIEGEGNCVWIGDFNSVHGTVSKINIENNIINSLNSFYAGSGIHGRYGTDITITNNKIYGGIGASSINLYKLKNTIVTGNYVYGNQDYAGIESEDTYGKNVISNNVIINCAHGVWIDDSLDVLVSDNIIKMDTAPTHYFDYNTNTKKTYGLGYTFFAGILFTCAGISTELGIYSERIDVSNNTITGYPFGVHISEPYALNNPDAHIKGVKISDNYLLNCYSGIVFDTATIDDSVTDIYITNNVMDFYANENIFFASATKGNDGINLSAKTGIKTIKSNTINNFADGIDLTSLEVAYHTFDISYNTIKNCTTSVDVPFDVRITMSNNYLDNFCNVNPTQAQSGGFYLGYENIIKDNSITINNRENVLVGGNAKKTLRTSFSVSGLTNYFVAFDSSYVKGSSVIACSSRNQKNIIGIVESETDKYADPYWNFVVTSGVVQVYTDEVIAVGDYITNTSTGLASKVLADENIRGVALTANVAGLNLISIYLLENPINNQSYLNGSATYDPPSMADGEGATTTVTVTGAALGDFAIVSFNKDLSGITLTAYVSAADTVSVRFQNESGGLLDLVEGILRVKVIKA